MIDVSSSQVLAIGLELNQKIFALNSKIVKVLQESAIVNCSQTKFVAFILVLSVLFYAIFRLTDFSSDAFDFSSSKAG